MKKLAVLFILITSTLVAQETITKKIGDFNTLKVFNGLRVSIVKGNQNSLEISGKRSNDVVVKNINGKLKISLNIPGVFNPQDVDVIQLTYAEEIAVLDANEGAIITSKNPLKQTLLEVRVQEGASIDLTVAIDNLKCKAVTGGDLELIGIAINQTIEVATGGNFDGKELISENTTVKAATGGEAIVFSTNTVNAKASLSGEIYIYGNPKKVAKKQSLAGTIQQKN